MATIISITILFSCNKTTTKLPILGEISIVGNDTIYPKVSDFKFINQDSLSVTNETFKNKIYIADFIFLNCPTICPKMTTEMLDVYKTFQDNPNILFLSHTIDPKNDSIPRLKKYATNLGVDPKKWHFVTGEKEAIYSIAENAYYATTYSDITAPGGYVHSGGLLLIDKNRNIRGVYDGTNPIETERLKSDLNKLLIEQF